MAPDTKDAREYAESLQDIIELVASGQISREEGACSVRAPLAGVSGGLNPRVVSC